MSRKDAIDTKLNIFVTIFRAGLHLYSLFCTIIFINHKYYEL